MGRRVYRPAHDEDRTIDRSSPPCAKRGTGARSRVIIALPPETAPRHFSSENPRPQLW